MRERKRQNEIIDDPIEHCVGPSTSQKDEQNDTPRKRRLKRKVQALHTKLWRKSQSKRQPHKIIVDNLMAQMRQYCQVKLSISLKGRYCYMKQKLLNIDMQ